MPQATLKLRCEEPGQLWTTALLSNAYCTDLGIDVDALPRCIQYRLALENHRQKQLCDPSLVTFYRSSHSR
ncbi:hypothetical protein BDR04DRAFT_1099139 [Suillus decipiens]|nr:hypothetical protein BDR04DRAFT_1099139 [Suillus decipiens]